MWISRKTQSSLCASLLLAVWGSGVALAQESEETPRAAASEAQEASEMERSAAAGQCPAEHSEQPIYLPDSERCDLFYECAFGSAQGPFQCPSGTLFDRTSGYCAPVWWVRCGR